MHQGLTALARKLILKMIFNTNSEAAQRIELLFLLKKKNLLIGKKGSRQDKKGKENHGCRQLWKTTEVNDLLISKVTKYNC